MLLTLGPLLLAALAHWAGFRARPQPAQHLSRAAFFINLALAGFAGYFAWPESRALAELTELIQPFAGIVEISYVPTSAEVQALSGFLAAVPEVDAGRGRLDGGTLVRRAGDRTEEYRLVTTEFSPELVLAYYRTVAFQDGWSVADDQVPWLFLGREDATLLIFVSSPSPRPGTRVLHAFSPAASSAAEDVEGAAEGESR